MPGPVRTSVDLSAYPDLVVLYLGYRANSARGLLSLMQIGKGLVAIKAKFPEGLLAHEFMMLGLFHVGFRQYWRDFESLEAFTKAPQHAHWWNSFGKNTRGGGFWHETYCRSGGMEAMYLNMPKIGLASFAPPLTPVGPFMTSAGRLDRHAESKPETQPG